MEIRKLAFVAIVKCAVPVESLNPCESSRFVIGSINRMLMPETPSDASISRFPFLSYATTTSISTVLIGAGVGVAVNSGLVRSCTDAGVLTLGAENPPPPPPPAPDPALGVGVGWAAKQVSV